MSAVRLAMPGDEAELLRLARLIHEEIGHFSFNEGKVLSMIRKGLDRQGGIIGVIGEPDHLQGSIYLLLDPVWYSDDYNLVELWNFVDPEFRHSRNGIDLVEFAKSCAEKMKMDLFIGIFNTVRLEAKARLYDRHLPRAGVFYLYKPSMKEMH